MHRLKNSVFFITLILALALGSRADEVTWNNTAGNNRWQTSGSNWWLASATAAVPFGQGNAVVFGDDSVPNVVTARPGTISITESGGVIIGASGTNPGMIVTGSGNWNFMFTATYTGTATGTAAPANIGITDGGAGASAGVLMQGTGTLTFSTTTGYTGATNVAAGTLRLGVANAIARSSAVNVSSTATLDLASNNQTLMALNLVSGAQVVFGGSNTNYATLTLGALGGDGGKFTMRVDLGANAGTNTGDRIVLTGSATGAHTLNFINTATTAPRKNTVLRVVDVSNALFTTATTFNGATEAGIYTYNVKQNANGAWDLTNTDRASLAQDAVLQTAAVAGQDWHYALDTLYKRMGDLREPPYGGDGAAGAQGGAGNLWMRGNFSRLNVGNSLTGHGFHQYNYGLTLGADKALASAAGGGMLWFAGGFGDWQRVSRGFDNGGDGSTSTLGGGLYLTWMHADGWYADLIGRIDRNKNKFNARALDGFVTSANYNNNTQGLSIEFGRQIYWPQDWWIEPAIQYAIAGIGGANYAATSAGQPPIDVHVSSATASQTRLQLRFGEAGGENPGWHPYATVAAVYSNSSGGCVRADDSDPFAANYDGWRWEVGFGAAYVINERSQFYYNYEYAHATRYNRPWTLSAGYRLMW